MKKQRFPLNLNTPNLSFPKFHLSSLSLNQNPNPPNFTSLHSHWIKTLIPPILLFNIEEPISLVPSLDPHKRSSQRFSVLLLRCILALDSQVRYSSPSSSVYEIWRFAFCIRWLFGFLVFFFFFCIFVVLIENTTDSLRCVPKPLEISQITTVPPSLRA